GGSLSAVAEVQVTTPFAFSAKLNVQNVDLAPLERLAPDVKLPVAVKGRVHASADLRGTAEPLKMEGEVSLKAPYLRIQNITTEELQGTLALEKNVIQYRLAGKALGGTFELEGHVPQPGSDDKDTKKSHLKINAIEIARLVRA